MELVERRNLEKGSVCGGAWYEIGVGWREKKTKLVKSYSLTVLVPYTHDLI